MTQGALRADRRDALADVAAIERPDPRPLIITVVAWSCLLFCGFGLLSRANPTTLVMLALGASAVASALFLIMELSQPYTSMLEISPVGLEQVIVNLDK